MYNTDLPTRAELPSSRRLLHSTAIALVVAIGLLTTAVLPAEYGIDPTGIGKTLGLTQMGQIKMSLAAENAKGAPVANPATPAPAPAVGATSQPLAAPVAAAAVVAPVVANATLPATSPPAAAPVTLLKHEMTVTLKPGQAAEIKLEMRKGASVAYTWQTAGGPVNFDTHGDPPNAPKDFYHGYGKGRGVASDKGTLEAAFDGKHGWFWRNRGSGEVRVTLNTEGQYTAIKRVL